MRCDFKIWTLLVCTAICPRLADAAPAAVGDMGAVDRLDVAGARFVSPERLKHALACDLEFMLAAEPTAALDSLLKVIQRRLEAGYLRSGFADAVVEVRPNLQTRRIVALVTEGPRYRAGPIRLVGQSHVSPRDLASWLSAPHPVGSDCARVAWLASEELVVVDDVAEKPIWTPGEPARFNSWSREQLTRQVHLALAEHGYFFPKLTVKVMPVADRGLAELVIELEDEGPPGVIGQVEVVGAQRHSPDAILRYLELAPGQPLNRGRLADMQRRLYESARFVFFAAIPQPPAVAGGAVKLTLKVIEAAQGPLLGQPFSAEEQALLRLRDWLGEQIRSGKEDLTLALRDASTGERTLHLVVSARGLFLRADVSDPSRALTKGVLFKLRNLAAANPAKHEPLHCLAGVEMLPEQIALYSPMRDRLFATTPGDRRLTLRLKLQPDPRQQGKLAISLDPDVERVDGNQPAQPVAVEADLAPAAFVILAHAPEAKCKVEQGVLRIKTNSALLETDAASGRLIRATVHDAKREQEATLTAAPRQLERSVAEMRRLSSGDRNDYDPRRPMTSLTAFGICEMAHLWRAWEGVALAGDRHGFDAWQGLLAAYFLPDLDEQQAGPADTDAYFIPAEPLAPGRPPRGGNALAIAAEALHTCRDIFPAESWPCRLARAAVLYYANDDRGAQRELTRLDSTSAGPLGHLAAALVASMFEPALVNRFATGGLEKLTIADFHRDYSLVLESRSPIVESALNGLGQLSKLDPASSQAALSVLPRPLASFVGDLIVRQRTLPDAPTDVVLAGLLDDYWTGGLEVQARFVLRWLADSPPPTAAKAKTKTRVR